MLRKFIWLGVVLACGPSVGHTAVVVVNSVADAEEHVNDPGISGEARGMDLSSSDLELISEGDGGLDWQVVGLQYSSLGI